MRFCFMGRFFLQRWSIQPLELWRGASLSALPSEMFAFQMAGPLEVDMLGLCGSLPDSRSQIHQWTLTPSDLDGCLCLHLPQVVKAPMALTSRDVPVLALLDELQANYLIYYIIYIYIYIYAFPKIFSMDDPKVILCGGGRRPPPLWVGVQGLGR